MLAILLYPSLHPSTPSCCFNMGVMVIDLVRWQKIRYGMRIERWMEIQKNDWIYELGSLSRPDSDMPWTRLDSKKPLSSWCTLGSLWFVRTHSLIRLWVLPAPFPIFVTSAHLISFSFRSIFIFFLLFCSFSSLYYEQTYQIFYFTHFFY